jgi:hypothetical protein
VPRPHLAVCDVEHCEPMVRSRGGSGRAGGRPVIIFLICHLPALAGCRRNLATPLPSRSVSTSIRLIWMTSLGTFGNGGESVRRCRFGATSTNVTRSSGDCEQRRGGGAPGHAPGTTFRTSTFTSTWRWDGEGGDTPAVLLDSCLGHAEVSPPCQNEFAANAANPKFGIGARALARAVLG